MKPSVEDNTFVHLFLLDKIVLHIVRSAFYGNVHDTLNGYSKGIWKGISKYSVDPLIKVRLLIKVRVKIRKSH